jgi:hypothetical protein
MESIWTIRHGSDQPLPGQRKVIAGPLSAMWEDGTLRRIILRHPIRGEVEVVRQLYMAVRDRYWGTVLPRLSIAKFEVRDNEFEIGFSAENRSDEVDFSWDASMIGRADGEIEFSFVGRASKDFWRNRIGLCVLHPMELSGTPVEVVTPDGTVSGVFPEAISPHQPFKHIRAIRHPAILGLADAEIVFEGEWFEMEDQRNWTDASFKTYGTPLDLPFPVPIKEGETIRQKVTIRVLERAETGTWEAPQWTAGPEGSSGEQALDEGITTISVSEAAAGRVPALGLIWNGDSGKIVSRHPDLWKAMQLSHLRVELHLINPDWAKRLDHAGRTAHEIRSSLELEVVCGDQGFELPALFDRLSSMPDVIQRLFVYSDSHEVSTAEILSAARKCMADRGLRFPLMGGSRTWFTELNRAKQLPLNLLEGLGYAMSPQVHAIDNASLIETLPVQALIADNAKRIVGDLPLHIGPITLKPPCRAVAVGERPVANDPRQASLFGAGWTIGSLYQVSLNERVGSATYYDLTGECGVVGRDGQAFAVYHVLADAGEFALAQTLRMHVEDPTNCSAIALHSDGKIRVLAASYRDIPIRLRLKTPRFEQAIVRMLDETTYASAYREPLLFRQQRHRIISGVADTVELDLLPYAIATVDLQLPD